MLTPTEFRKLAVSLKGIPYILGAESSPDRIPKALDCSELVQWLYARNGTPITDGAWLQYAATIAVTGSPQVGDLVFLRNNAARSNGIGHVAVLTAKLPNGDWEIVEARGRAYGVVVTTLSYWRTRAHFVGPRRYPAFKLLACRPANRLFRLTTANVRAAQYGGLPSASSARGEELALIKPSIITVQEADEDTRNAIRKTMGKSWVVRPVGMVGVMFRNTSWHEIGHEEIAFGNTVHGAALSRLRSLENNSAIMNVISVHNRSKQSFPADKSDSWVTEAKRGFISLMFEELEMNGPTVIAGDFNLTNADDLFTAQGFTRASPAGSIDQIWTRDIDTRGMVRRRANTSDHDWLTLQGTLKP